MTRLISLGINFAALSEGACPTLHPYLESYEVELTGEARQADPVIIYLDAEG